MGAAQALAAAGSKQRSPQLVGLLLMSLDKRWRFGLRLTDKLGLAPTGENTFGVADFTSAVANLRVVQYEALGDWMNNADWIKTLKSPQRLYAESASSLQVYGYIRPTWEHLEMCRHAPITSCAGVKPW